MITYDEVEIGDLLPSLSVPVHRVDLIRYCGASGDFNIIHWNERVATSVGLPNVIAHGMYTMAVAVRVVTDWLGDPGAVTEYSVRFTRPIAVPDPDGTVLEIAGKVTSKEADGGAGGSGILGIDLTATVGGQTVLARARVLARVRAS
jgi:acyl dehydratase